MKSAQDIANFFLSHSYGGEMDDLTNLKLQKLLYYTQGYALAYLARPLFSDQITAWRHGPVVESVYHSYKQYGKTPLPALQNYSLSNFDQDEIFVINKVASTYGQYSPWRLRNMTHQENPWLITPQDCYIDHNEIRNYFMSIIKETTQPIEKPFNYDLSRMKKAVEAPTVTVPYFDNDDDFDIWLNNLTDSDFTV